MFIFRLTGGKFFISVTASQILSITASNILAIGSWKYSDEVVIKHLHGLESELLHEVMYLLRIYKGRALTLTDYLESHGWVNFFIVIIRRQTVLGCFLFGLGFYN